MTQPFLPDIHCSADLERLFAQTFRQRYNTVLIGGSDQPLYQVANAHQTFNTIYFTQDYFASALHEVAHWCVAGVERRQQEDYGYWYAPDGRTEQQQQAFEQVEVKPQSLEWLFSVACGFRFRVSADNLTLGCGPSEAFKRNILRQVHDYLVHGIPDRAGQFCQCLEAYYGGDYRDKNRFSLESLD